MKRIRSKKLWAGTLMASAAAVVGLTLTTASAPADAERQGPGATKTIKMVFSAGPPSFTGPANVREGQNLRILNQTKPQEIGPHTFSLVEEEAVPDTNPEFRECGRLEFPVCEQVAKAHGVNPQTFNVNRPDVDRGADGWDRVFTSDTKGDTWFTEQKGESETRIVSAEAGTTLTYFCVIHPDTMVGSIEVKSGPER